MLKTLHRHFEQNPPALNIIYSILLLGIVGAANYLTGPEIILSVFYLVPVSIPAWYSGRRPAYVVAVMAIIVWFMADYFSFHEYSHSVIPYWNAAMRFLVILVVVLLLLKVKDLLKIEQTLARVDSLTGLANGRGFQEIARLELIRSSRHARSFTVAYIDLDNFKKVNDTYGHNTGDALLREVADVMKSSLREIDQVARLGGDEFIILLPEAGVDAAKMTIAKVQSNLQKRMEERKWPVTASMGVITFEAPPASINEMIKMVDNLMYTVKNSGKNSATFQAYKPSVVPV